MPEALNRTTQQSCYCALKKWWSPQTAKKKKKRIAGRAAAGAEWTMAAEAVASCGLCSSCWWWYLWNWFRLLCDTCMLAQMEILLQYNNPLQNSKSFPYSCCCSPSPFLSFSFFWSLCFVAHCFATATPLQARTHALQQHKDCENPIPTSV